VRGHNFAVGIFHGLGQVCQIIRPFGVEGDTRNDFGFFPDAAALIVIPGSGARTVRHRGAASLAVCSSVIRVGRVYLCTAPRARGGFADGAIQFIITKRQSTPARVGLGGHPAERVVDVTPIAQVGIVHAGLVVCLAEGCTVTYLPSK